MYKSFFKILTSLLLILPIMLNAAFSGGTYYGYEFGNNDYYSTMAGGDGTYTSESKFIFDGAGNFTAETLADSEGIEDPFNGTYTVENGVLTLQIGEDSFSLRISPDGETLAAVTARQTHDPEDDNEVLYIMVKESDVSSLSGTYYGYEFGNNDYYSTMPEGDGTYTSESKFIFDGAGNFSAETLADSEGIEDPFNGTYTVENGVLTLQIGEDSFSLRISPDGETLAAVTARQTHDPEDDNEVLYIMIKESDVSSLSGTYYGYEFGNNDYYSTMPEGDGTYTSESKFIFDGAGNFTAETLADSEGIEDPFNRTYTVENGVLTLQIGEDSFSLRISPDGETLAAVTARQTHDSEDDNEVLYIMIKESDVKVNIVPSITYLLF